MSTSHAREFGIIYEGDAEPLYCDRCDVFFCSEENLRKHARMHRRRP